MTMNEHLTDERHSDVASLDLDAIKPRAAAATEGPWEAATCHESEQETRSEYVRNALLKPDAPAHGLWVAWKPDSRLGVHLTAVTGDGPHGEADAEFIAHAREDIPALVAEVERLREERDELQHRLDAVLKLHVWHDCPDPGCNFAIACNACNHPYPCPTVKAARGEA